MLFVVGVCFFQLNTVLIYGVILASTNNTRNNGMCCMSSYILIQLLLSGLHCSEKINLIQSPQQTYIIVDLGGGVPYL